MYALQFIARTYCGRVTGAILPKQHFHYYKRGGRLTVVAAAPFVLPALVHCPAILVTIPAGVTLRMQAPGYAPPIYKSPFSMGRGSSLSVNASKTLSLHALASECLDLVQSIKYQKECQTNIHTRQTEVYGTDVHFTVHRKAARPTDQRCRSLE